MNRQEFEDTARRYREEMFRMYASQSMDPPPKPQPKPAPPPEPPRPALPPAKPDLPPQEIAPVLPHVREPIPAPPRPEPVPQNVPALSDNTADDAPRPSEYEGDTGSIHVHVMTAQGTRPVVGATVTVTRNVGGDVQLISLQTTDLSGNVAPVTVPAPPPSADQRDPEAYHYDISVQAAGYYREHSTDVPVFPHITSMQTFEMIPLPAGTDDPFPGGDITYYNGMQKY